MQPSKDAVPELWRVLRMGDMPRHKPKPRVTHELHDRDPLEPPKQHTGKSGFPPDLVREMRASTATHIEWADRLGVHESTIRQCRNGRTYRDVT